MKIAMIASEATPLAKTGGLADVIGTLSVALARLGHRVCVVIPGYRSALQASARLSPAPIAYSVTVGDRPQQAAICTAALGEDIPVYLIRADPYFDREHLYGGPTGDYADNAERFAFFSRAALELVRREGADIIHCHDWQTALAVVFLKVQKERYPELASARNVFTIHNLGFQGIFPQSTWPLLQLEPAYFTPRFLEYYGSVNFLKGALIFADKITTVSPSYAEEIMEPEQGFGLEGVLRERASDVVGILNGFDDHHWNPSTDPYLVHHYGPHTLAVKQDCKRALQRLVGLAERADVPVIGMISRLTLQKGFDLLEQILGALLQRDVQFVLLGNGEPRFEDFFKAAALRAPGRVAVKIGFDDPLAHHIEAGADLFLMPSRYEPCGLNQMFSLKYGTIPVVRAVGGLKDTVEDYEPHSQTGTGFVFGPYDAASLLRAIDRALKVFRQPQAWTAIQQRAMAKDFSWNRSAMLYSDLYRQLCPEEGRDRGR